MREYLYTLLFVCLPFLGRATHVIGGEMTMQSLGKPGYYRIQLNQYLDAANTSTSNRETVLTVNIFRKRAPMLVDSYQLSARTLETVAYKNATCAKAKNLGTLNAAYSADVQLDVSKYADPAGYYIVWERCCRNHSISNLADPVDVGMVFYLEFPALLRNGVVFANSSPVFGPLNGNFICLNKLFTTAYAATDADGDQLRYSLVTPYQGYTDATIVVGTNVPRLTYPTVTWGAGFSAAAAIPGSPALQIDATTGQLSVKASLVGYFLFSVQCDEYRNGEKIGSIRRDFQIPVVDCPRDTPPIPVVKENGLPDQDVKICEGASLTLTTDSDPKWAYQWQRNGINVAAGNVPILTVTDSGTYTVVRSFSATCSNDTTSQATQVQVLPNPNAHIRLTALDGVTAALLPVCEGTPILASTSVVVGGNGYRWQTTSSALQVSNNVVTVTKSGLYSLTVTDGTSQCTASDQLQIDFKPGPLATLAASATQICVGDSVRLTTTDSLSYKYAWEPAALNKRAELWVKQPGTYRVRITNAAGCTAVSPDRLVAVAPLPTVAADSIAPVCASSPQLLLAGTPTTGVWSGPGVAGSKFDPAVAGVGLQPLRYTVTSAAGCPGVVYRWVRVTPPLLLAGPVTYQVQRGDAAHLQQQPNDPTARLLWSPPRYLDKADVPAPVYQSGESTTYTVQAQTASGCLATVQVEVHVFDRLYIPTAFSPDGDGMNETWKPINSEAFPECEIAVFNRWGELVYQGTGPNAAWDGTYHQAVVEPGIYTYLVKTSPSGSRYTGKLAVLRK